MGRGGTKYGNNVISGHLMSGVKIVVVVVVVIIVTTAVVVVLVVITLAVVVVVILTVVVIAVVAAVVLVVTAVVIVAVVTVTVVVVVVLLIVVEVAARVLLHLIVVLVVIVNNLKSCFYISVYFRYLPVLHFISVLWIVAQYSLRSSAARRKHQAKWLTALATGGRTRVWSMMQNIKASCIKMWVGFLRLKPTWVTGVSLANHRGCTPVFCSRRLHSVYSLCSSEYSKI